MIKDELTFSVIGFAMKVNSTLSSGLLINFRSKSLQYKRSFNQTLIPYKK